MAILGHNNVITRLLLRDLDVTLVDSLNDIVRGLLVDSAANALAGTKDLLDGAGEVATERLEAHGPRNLDDLIQRDIATVLNVLDLLAVTRRLLQGLDDQRRGRRHNGHSSLTVLDSQLDGHTETLPLARGLGNVFTDLLRRLYGC